MAAKTITMHDRGISYTQINVPTFENSIPIVHHDHVITESDVSGSTMVC